MNDDYDLRLECVRIATDIDQSTLDPDEVLETAKKIYAFVTNSQTATITQIGVVNNG